MKRLLFGSLLVSVLVASAGVFAATSESGAVADTLSDLDMFSKKGQSVAPKGGVAVFMARGSTVMTMTVVGHEAPCDFTLFDQAREFSRFQMANRAPFSYCVLGRTNQGTPVKVAIADYAKKPSAGKYVVGGKVGGGMAPAYWDESSKILVLAGFRVSDVAASAKEVPSLADAKTLVCGVTVAELSGARPDIGTQQGSCASLRAMYYAFRLLNQANADLSADNLDKAEAGFGAVHVWLTDNKVDSVELVEAKLGEGSVRSEKNDYLAAARSYTEARDLLKRIDPSWDDMRAVIGWRLSKVLAASNQFETGMREISRLNQAPHSCRNKCLEGLIETLERYINWAKRQNLAAEERLLSARILVLKGDID